MTTTTLPDPAFPFMTQLSRQLKARSTASTEVLQAVGLLTATADPARAERLRPRAGEPPALIERLAVWALHRVDADTIVLAHQLLHPSTVALDLAAAERTACPA